MAIPDSAIAQVLRRIHKVAEDADLSTALGLPYEIKIRHHRHRKANKSELPCLSIRLVNVEQAPDYQHGHSMAEIVWRMTVDLIVDLELQPEGENDPTGWGDLSGIASAYANLYLDEDSPIRSLVDDVLPGDVDPDEDSRPDEGRLAISINVIYRTLRNDLNHVLSSEENGL